MILAALSYRIPAESWTPAGTVDPTPGLYNQTMYLMAALLGIALVCNALMRPVDSRHHL